MPLKYVGAEELLSVLDNRAMSQLTDDVDDAVGPIIDPAVVETALAHAESMAESYVQSRYALPLADPYPLAFVRAVLVIARRYLYARRQIDDDMVEREYNEALRWLLMVTTEQIDLYNSDALADLSEVHFGTSFNPVFDSRFFL